MCSLRMSMHSEHSQNIKEREMKMMEIKMDRIGVIINHRLSAHEIMDRFIVSSDLCDEINLNLFHHIDEWKGVCFQRIKVQPTTFRAYFVIGKNWWDAIKRKFIGSALWIPLFHRIEAVEISTFYVSSTSMH